jgi:hypothetical protein
MIDQLKLFSQYNRCAIEYEENPHALIQAKKNDTVIIAGSGPSLSLIESPLLADVAFDLIGTVNTVMLKREPSFLFFESTDIAHLPDGPSSTGSLKLFYYDAAMSIEFLRILRCRSSIKIILNPMFPVARLSPLVSYFTPLPKGCNATLPRYYYINESNDELILRGLKDYIDYPHSSILNFRCSMVRALSLAFELGYDKIILLGLDPSSPLHWYSSDGFEDLICGEVDDIMIDLLVGRRALHKANLSGRIKHEGEFYANTNFGMNASIWFSIAVLDARRKALGKFNSPDITYMGSDSSSLDYISYYTKRNRVSVIEV